MLMLMNIWTETRKITRQAIGPGCIERNCSKYLMKGCLRLVINEFSHHCRMSWTFLNALVIVLFYKLSFCHALAVNLEVRIFVCLLF